MRVRSEGFLDLMVDSLKLYHYPPVLDQIGYALMLTISVSHQQ